MIIVDCMRKSKTVPKNHWITFHPSITLLSKLKNSLSINVLMRIDHLALFSCTLCILLLCSSCRSSFPINVAPIWQEEGAMKTRSQKQGLGPLFTYLTTTDGSILIALRPFWSYFNHPRNQRSGVDLLWPLAALRLTDNYLRSYALILIYNNSDVHNSNSSKRFYILPFYLAGKDSHGIPYLALFPFVGSIRDFIGFDKLSFFLFPLYLSTHKNGVTGRHFLFPIFSTVDDTNKEIRKRRIFPLWGYSRKEKKFMQYFILWPFIHYRYSLHPTINGNSFFLFPFYGIQRYYNKGKNQSFRQDTILWPFFTYARTEVGYQLKAPWPFVVRSRNFHGPKSRRFYLWPLFGHTERSNETSSFYLWPFIHHYHGHQGTLSTKRYYLFPLYWSIEKHDSKALKDVYRHLWPLGSYHKNVDREEQQLRILDLWPQRKNVVIERNWAPLWTLYSYQSKEEHHQHNALWGLFQYHYTNTHTKKLSISPLFQYKSHSSKKEDDWTFDLLTGLVGYEKKNDKSRWRLLWFLRF